MAKRGLEQVEEFVEVTDVSHACENAKIHSVVNSLSPTKKSKNCAYALMAKFLTEKPVCAQPSSSLDQPAFQELSHRHLNGFCVSHSASQSPLLFHIHHPSGRRGDNVIRLARQLSTCKGTIDHSKNEQFT